MVVVDVVVEVLWYRCRRKEKAACSHAAGVEESSVEESTVVFFPFCTTGSYVLFHITVPPAAALAGRASCSVVRTRTQARKLTRWRHAGAVL